MLNSVEATFTLGLMLEEMAMALSDLGVVQQFIYKEPYFDPIHDPDRDIVAAIRAHISRAPVKRSVWARLRALLRRLRSN